MSKQPVGVTPITVPTVAVYTTRDGIKDFTIGGLYTSSGPVGVEDRHAHLNLSQAQAEALVYELAAKLGLEVTP